MADRTPPPYEDSSRERRTPLDNDVDPDGMDSDTEGDELEAGNADVADSDIANGPDGSRDRHQAGQRRTSGTHGAAGADTTPRQRRG